MGFGFSVILPPGQAIQAGDRAPQWLERMRDTNSCVTRWYLSLQPYNFMVDHCPRAANKVADLLSCIPEEEV